jgi:hypothetical protein
MRFYLFTILFSAIYCLPVWADNNTLTIKLATSSPPTEDIKIYRGQGLTINFSGANQVVQSAWLDNESVIGISASDCLAGINANSCDKKPRATVLHLKYLFNSVHPGRSKRTLLTVETTDLKSQRRIYRYTLIPSPDLSPPQAITLVEYLPPPVAVVPPQYTSSQEIATRLRISFNRAKSRGLVNDPVLISRVNKFIALVDSGVPPSQAARMTNLSPELVNRLYY